MEATSSLPIKDMGSFRGGYLLAVESFRFLRKDPEIALIPILAAGASVVFMAIMGGLGYLAYEQGIVGLVFPPEGAETATMSARVLGYGALLLWYLGTAFILAFFQGAIITMVHMRISGQDPTVADGIRNARRLLSKFLLWSAFSATLGLIFNVISERLGWLGKMLGFGGAIAWGVLTFFIVPVLTLENISVRQSVLRSGKIFKDVWGETLVMHFSLGVFFGVLYLLWFLICLVPLFFFLFSESFFSAILAGVLLLLGILALTVVSAALGAIFKTVLYVYASTGKIPDSFTRELIIGAIKRKV